MNHGLSQSKLEKAFIFNRNDHALFSYFLHQGQKIFLPAVSSRHALLRKVHHGTTDANGNLHLQVAFIGICHSKNHQSSLRSAPRAVASASTLVTFGQPLLSIWPSGKLQPVCLLAAEDTLQQLASTKDLPEIYQKESDAACLFCHSIV